MNESALRLPRWNHVLLEIYKCQDKPSYSQRLNRRLKASLTHIREIVKQLEACNLIEVQPKQKIKHLVLTDKGRRIAASLQEVKFELNGTIQNESVS